MTMTQTVLSPAATKAMVKRLNDQLAPLNQTLHRSLPLTDVFSILRNNDLDPDAVVLNDETNNRINVQVAPDVFFAMSWYQYATGRYEVICYVTSTFDDYREPYTTVLKGKDKKRATAKLNDLLDPINSTYFSGKAAAFDAIQEAIANSGFDYYEFEDATVAGRVNSDAGRINVEIGNGIFISVSWYRMDVTGRYEIVTIAS